MYSPEVYEGMARFLVVGLPTGWIFMIFYLVDANPYITTFSVVVVAFLMLGLTYQNKET